MLSRVGLRFTSTELGPLPSASLERHHSVGDLDLYVAISCAAVDDGRRLCRLWSRRIAQRLWHRRGHDHGGCHHSLMVSIGLSSSFERSHFCRSPKHDAAMPPATKSPVKFPSEYRAPS